MDALFGYKSMPEWHRSNIKDYYILDGIYTVFPSISEEDARFIYDICMKVDNENINPFSIAHYLTDNYTRGILTKDQIEKATSGEISEAVFYDNLNYFSSVSEEIEETKEYESI